MMVVGLHDTGPRGRYHGERRSVGDSTVRHVPAKSLADRLSGSDCPSSTMCVDMSPAVNRLARHSPKG